MITAFSFISLIFQTNNSYEAYRAYPDEIHRLGEIEDQIKVCFCFTFIPTELLHSGNIRINFTDFTATTGRFHLNFVVSIKAPKITVIFTGRYDCSSSSNTRQHTVRC